MRNDKWWEVSFGHTLWIDVDHRVRSDERIHSDVDSIIKLAQLKPGDSVLDIACGAGRHSHVFSELGYRVVGLDQSLPALRRASELGKEASTDIVFVHGDMRAMPISNAPFRCAFNVYTSWAMFDTDQENVAVITEAHRSLQTGGTLVLEYTNKWAPDNPPVTRSPLDMGDYLYERTAEFDRGTGVYSGTEIYRWKQNNEVRQDDWRMSIYRSDELLEILRAAGFSSVELYGDWQGSDLGDDSKRIVAVAVKTQDPEESRDEH